MAQKFVLTAALNIQAPSMNKVVRNINQQLKGVNLDLNVPNAAKTSRDLQNVSKNLKNISKDAKTAGVTIKQLGASLGSTVGQFIKYDIARAAINLLTRAISDGLSDAIKFEREMVKIAQVTGATASKLKDLERSITRVATEFGVASMSLLQASRVLSQTGKSADEVKVALEALAKTTLAPTFDSLIDTTETAVAVMAQFKIEAKDLERVLGSINAVAGKFAVEAGDLGVAIKRAGGAFRSAGGEVEQLIALFTSVRSTTRETAETIATGFRTIFTRLQRPTTIKFLRQFGVELQDLNGKFVGPYEAVRKLHLVLKDLDPRDIRYSQIVEQLGGFRQVSKVIPLIQEFQTAQQALNVAQAGGNSLSKDAAKAQGTFAVKITKLKEEVKELFRVISESTAFKVMLDGAIAITSALTNLATALGPIIPMLTAVFAIRGIGALGSFTKNIGRGIATQGGKAFARGGMVPGTGTGDTVPARLTPGEFVIRKSAVQAFGSDNLHKINKYAGGGTVEDFATKGSQAKASIKKLGFRSTAHKWISHDYFAGLGRKDTIHGNVNKGKDTRITTDQIKELYKNDANAYGPVFKSLSYNNTVSAELFENIVADITGMKKNPVTNAPIDLLGALDSTASGMKLGEVKFKKRSTPDNAILNKAFRQHLTNKTNLLKSTSRDKALKYGRDEINIKNISLYEPANKSDFVKEGTKYRASISKANKGRTQDIATNIHNQALNTVSSKTKRLAAGGAITSQGTDSVPALLTPGEFVVNKKSAQAIGYNKLHKINGYATGGIVGGDKNRLKMFGGGGIMDMMMLMGGLGSGLGGGGEGQTNTTSAANNASSALNGLAKQTKKTSGTFRSGLGDVTSGLGKVATSSLMAYSKVQFFGAAVDSTITAMGIENETIHKTIGWFTTFGSAIYATVIALQALQSTQILQGLGNMFNSIGGPALARNIGPRLGDLMAIVFGETLVKAGRKGGKAVTSGVRSLSRGSADVRRFNQLRGRGMDSTSMLNREATLNRAAAKAERAAATGRNTRLTSGGSYRTPNQRLAQAGRLRSQASSFGEAARTGTRARAAGRASLRLGKMLKNPFNLATIAITAFTLATSLSTSSQEELNEKMKESSSWEDVASTARSRAVGAGLEGVGTAGAANIAAKTAGKIVGKMIAAKTGRVIAGLVPSGGTNVIVEAILLIGEVGYGLAMAADTMNNAIADFDSAQFAKKQAELARSFEAFEKGLLNSGAMATKLANVQALDVQRTEQIARDKDTGKLGIAGAFGKGGSFDVMVDAFKGGDWVAGLGAGLATGLQTMLSVFSFGAVDISNATGARNFWGRDNDAIAADETAQARSRVEQREMAPKIAAKAMEDALTAMRNTKDSDIGAAGDTAFIRGLGGMENAAVVAELMGVSLETLRKRFKEQADELKPIIEAEREYEKAVLEMARSTRAALDIIMSIRSIAPAIAELEGRIANTMSGFVGGISAANIADKSSQFSTEAIASISTPEQWKALEANVESLTGYLGVAGSLIQSEFLGGAQIMGALPDALETLKNDMTNLTGDTSDPGDRVIKELTARIGQANWDKIPQTIKDRLRSKINSLDINAENFDENFDAILDDVAAGFDPYSQAIQEASKAVFKYNKIYGAALAQRNQMEMSFIQGQMKLLKLQESGEKIIRDATGGKLTAADSAAAFKAQQQTLLGGGSGLAGGAVTGPGGGLASELGVAELGSLYGDQKKKLAELNKQISATTATKGNEAKEVKALQDEYGELQKQTEQTKQALQNYTDVQKRAAGIQAELSREQEARKTKRGVLSDFAFADDAGRASQIKGMQSAFTAIQAGDLGAVSEGQRGAVGQFLDRFENISLQAFGGKTGGDIKKELEIKELEKVMGRALSGDEKKQIMESTTKEDKLINDLRALNEEAAVAQTALNDGIKVSIDEMNTNIAELNKKFLDDLRDIFGARQKQRLKSEEGKAIKGINDVLNDQAQAESALVSVIGQGQFDNLQATEEGRAKLDDMLRVLTASKDSLAKVKAATELKGQIGGAIERTQAFTGTSQTGIADSIEDITGAWAQFDDMELSDTAAAIQAQTTGMVGMVAPGAGRDAALSASNRLNNILDRISAGNLTIADAVEGDAAAAKAFEAAFGTGSESEKIKETGITANEAAILAETYMSSALNAEQMQATSQIGTAQAALGEGGLFSQAQIDAMIGDSGTLTEKLASILPDTTFTKLNTQLESLAGNLESINEAQRELNTASYSENEPKPINRMRGGPVYASRGMFIPKGTDTVPAMLTPGEFVIRKNAVKAVGMPLLQRINNMGKGGRQHGGNGYYANGGQVAGGLALDFSGLDASINKFSQQITRLGNALSGGFSINVGGEININVRLNGAEMLEGAKDALGQVAADKVEKGITRMLKQHFPKLNNKSGLHRIKE